MGVTAGSKFWMGTVIRGKLGERNWGIRTVWSPRELLQRNLWLTKVVDIGESDSLD